MRIRPFRKDDEDAVITLWNECGLTRAWNDPRNDIARKLTVQPELFLVAEEGGQLVATLMAGYEGHRGWVNYLAVSPPHRRRGYARVLMQQAETRLVALGYLRDEAVSLGKRLIPDQPSEHKP